MSAITVIDQNVYNQIIVFPEGQGSIVLICNDPTITVDPTNPTDHLVMVYVVLNDTGSHYYSRPVNDLLNYTTTMNSQQLITFASQLSSVKSSNVIQATAASLPDPA